MNKIRSEDEKRSESGPLWIWLGAGLLLSLMVVLLAWPRGGHSPEKAPAPVSGTGVPTTAATSSGAIRSGTSRHRGLSEAATAEEIVARKLAEFSKRRRALVHAIAKHFNVEVPGDVERFFAAVEAGRWEEIDAAHEALLMPGQGLNQPRSAELHKIWRAIQETWGIAREAHNWPAQTLLDYGEAALGSLRPGMVYVGGTDPGCFIPTFLNETAEGEHHITLTQNALADGTYLDYLNFLYAGQMNTLTQDDSQRAFQNYVANAQRRLEHDQQFPNEPKQILPGEDVRIEDGRVQVSGQVAVMSINERLLQTLMEKNPELSFAMEESFAFKSTYSNAAPLGPLMELGVKDPQNAWTADRAAQSVDYWRNVAQQLLSDPQIPDGSDPRKAYSKMVSAQASLLLDHNYPAEAEQAFRVANQIYPASPEVVFRYVQLLVDQHRPSDAIPIIENAIRAAPDQQQFKELLNKVKSAK